MSSQVEPIDVEFRELRAPISRASRWATAGDAINQAVELAIYFALLWLGTHACIQAFVALMKAIGPS